MFKMGKKEGVVVFVFFPQKPSRQQMSLMPIRIIHLVLVLGSLCTNKHAILIKQWWKFCYQNKTKKQLRKMLYNGHERKILKEWTSHVGPMEPISYMRPFGPCNYVSIIQREIFSIYIFRCFKLYLSKDNYRLFLIQLPKKYFRNVKFFSIYIFRCFKLYLSKDNYRLFLIQLLIKYFRKFFILL